MEVMLCKLIQKAVLRKAIEIRDSSSLGLSFDPPLFKNFIICFKL